VGQKDNKIIIMKKNITNLIILDASSSMSHKAEEVRDGLKDLMKDIKKDMKENKEARMITIVCQFAGAGRFKVLLNTAERKDIKPTKLSELYKPSGMTALYDAIGEGFNLVGDKEDGVFVNILTDGQENDSQEFTKMAIKKMLDDAKESKWGVTFMGTTEDAIQNAIDLGIERGNTYQFADNVRGVDLSNKAKFLSRKHYTTTVMMSASADDIQVDNLMSDIEKDIEE